MGLRADLSKAGHAAPARYNPGMYKIALVALAVVLVALQYRLWIADGGWSQVHRLTVERRDLHAQNVKDDARNDAMQAEIDDLKSGADATEGRARADMGMIKRGETFFLTLGDPSSADPAGLPNHDSDQAKSGGPAD